MKTERLLTICLILALVGSILRVRSINSEIDISNKELKYDSQRINKLLENQISKERLEITNNYLSLDSNLILYDINNKPTRIYELIKETTLIFRFSVLNCSACVNAEIENIKELNINFQKLKHKIMFIGYYQDLRTQIYAYKSMKLDIPIYIIPTNNIGLLIEQQNNIPYYFIVNKNLVINNIFIPQKEQRDLTKEFLRTVTERFLK